MIEVISNGHVFKIETPDDLERVIKYLLAYKAIYGKVTYEIRKVETPAEGDNRKER